MKVLLVVTPSVHVTHIHTHTHMIPLSPGPSSTSVLRLHTMTNIIMPNNKLYDSPRNLILMNLLLSSRHS
jgi:hypothetical protein